MCGFLIPRYISAHQVELAEDILRILVASSCGGGQVFYCLLHILGDILIGEIEPTQTVLRILIALRCRLFIPRHSFTDPLLPLQELAESVLRVVQPSIGGKANVIKLRISRT